MSYKSLYSDDEWLTLQLAPVIVFLEVAAADKDIDKKEREEFVTAFATLPNLSGSFGREVFESINWNLLEMTHMAMERYPDLTQGLRDVNKLFTRIPMDQVEDFVVTLIAFGRIIAEASGKFLQPKTSAEEKVALARVQAALCGAK